MKIFAITGGIGSGKSAVAVILQAHGVKVIDADEVARQVVEPGEAAFVEIVSHFGDRVLAPDGSLDRALLSQLVFSNRAELDFLNSITHPAVAARIKFQLQQLELTNPDAMVFLVIPLLVETGGAKRYGVEVTVVVDVPPEVALARLVTLRNMSYRDAKARITAQASRADRLQAADYVLDNSGDQQELESKVVDLVSRLSAESS